MTQERQSIENRLSKSKSTSQSHIHNVFFDMQHFISLCVCVCVCVCVCPGRDGGEGDSLEEFMSAVSSQLDPATITRLKRQALHLKKVSTQQAGVYVIVVHVGVCSRKRR